MKFHVKFHAYSQCPLRTQEYHQLESFARKQLESLLELRAVRKWGLTATPKNESVATVEAMAVLFGVDIIGIDQKEALLVSTFYDKLRARFPENCRDGRYE
jgi:hypothetical protein